MRKLLKSMYLIVAFILFCSFVSYYNSSSHYMDYSKRLIAHIDVEFNRYQNDISKLERENNRLRAEIIILQRAGKDNLLDVSDDIAMRQGWVLHP